ncbi:MAG: type II toxin-antitoxin system HigB family toxin [Enterobacteriaceae bacterium]
MRIISVSTLKSFWEKHPDSEQQLKAWIDEARKADWKTPSHIKEHYKSASILKNNRVVFNIKGNNYRLITSVAYQFGAVYIKFIGSHSEYDEVDANTIDMNE